MIVKVPQWILFLICFLVGIGFVGNILISVEVVNGFSHLAYLGIILQGVFLSIGVYKVLCITEYTSTVKLTGTGWIMVICGILLSLLTLLESPKLSLSTAAALLYVVAGFWLIIGLVLLAINFKIKWKVKIIQVGQEKFVIQRIYGNCFYGDEEWMKHSFQSCHFETRVKAQQLVEEKGWEVVEEV